MIVSEVERKYIKIECTYIYLRKKEKIYEKFLVHPPYVNRGKRNAKCIKNTI